MRAPATTAAARSTAAAVTTLATIPVPTAAATPSLFLTHVSQAFTFAFYKNDPLLIQQNNPSADPRSARNTIPRRPNGRTAITYAGSLNRDQA
jgi:hypothetical protein